MLTTITEPYYLNLQNAFVDISLGEAAAKEIVRTLNFATFSNLAVDVRGGGAPLNGLAGGQEKAGQAKDNFNLSKRIKKIKSLRKK